MRKKRELTDNGTYHIIMRGLNKQNVFFEDSDKDYFLSVLKRYSEKLKMDVISYVLMDNHVHILLKDTESGSISDLVRRICISYTQHYFNRKYERVGSLFQSRFVSRIINNDEDLITVDRYINLNPAKAGFNAFNYKYSSYNDMLNSLKLHEDKGIIKSKYIRNILDNDTEYENFLHMYDSTFLDIEDYKMCDKEVVDYIKEAGKLTRSFELIKLIEKPVLLKEIVKSLVSNNISVSRLTRLTGIPRKIIIGFYEL